MALASLSGHTGRPAKTFISPKSLILWDTWRPKMKDPDAHNPTTIVIFVLPSPPQLWISSYHSFIGREHHNSGGISPSCTSGPTGYPPEPELGPLLQQRETGSRSTVPTIWSQGFGRLQWDYNGRETPCVCFKQRDGYHSPTRSRVLWKFDPEEAPRTRFV